MRKLSLVLDSHLLGLLVVGRFNRELISRHRRLDYDEDGFDLLEETIKRYSRIILIPQTLAETSNLLRYIGEPLDAHLTLALGQLLESHDERFVLSRSASKERAFSRLGLVDAALIVAARENAALISQDMGLYLEAASQGIEAINFNHLYDSRFG
jgi:hypothetical protein